MNYQKDILKKPLSAGDTIFSALFMLILLNSKMNTYSIKSLFLFQEGAILFLRIMLFPSHWRSEGQFGTYNQGVHKKEYIFLDFRPTPLSLALPPF